MYFDLNSREAAAILKAVGRDLANGAWGAYDWFDTDNSEDYALNLELSFTGPDKEGRDYISVAVNAAMTETVDCLKQLGLVTDQDLVTYRELYPEDYPQDYEGGVYDSALSGRGDVTVYSTADSAAVSPA